MRRIFAGALASVLMCSAANAVVVTPGDSTNPWLGFMNVFQLPSNGGGFVFGSPWGTADLNSSFNDGAGTVTLSPNTIGDPDPFWYTPAGGPGSQGNKIMEGNLYIQTTDVFNGQTVTFEGSVLSNSLTSAHVASVFIRDFAPDFSSVTEVIVPLTTGAFNISLATDPAPGRHIQWGFQIKGVNVWATDVAPFGNIVIGTVPAPASLGLLAMGGAMVGRRRRR